MNKPKIFIGMAVYNRIVDVDIMSFCFQLAGQQKYQLLLETVSGPYIDSNKNHMVQDFLTTQCEWLYIWDTDVVIYDPDFFFKLIETANKFNAKVVSAPYFIKTNEADKYCVAHLDENNVLVNYKKGELDKPMLVDAVGAGSMLIHRSVVENMQAPYFQIVPNEVGGMEMPEDFFFCQKVREAGHNIAVDTRISTYHFAPASWVHEATN
jgi:GT2 family glycosyltransferase